MIKKRWVQVLLAVACGSILIGAGYLLAHIFQPKPSPIPSSISSQLAFTPLVIPANIKTLMTSDYKTSVVEDGTHLLSYVIHIDNTTVTVSEYPQPSQFVDVTDFKSKFLDNVIHQTSSISTSSGTIILGQMAKQQNKQLAVMLEHGLVIFMAPTNTVTDSQWHTIGDTLDVVKPTN